MPPPQPRPPAESGLAPAPEARGRIVAVGLALVLAGAAAYANSLTGPLLFDDAPALAENPTIHSLWAAWRPPASSGLTVSGRPLLNWSFAVNYIIFQNNLFYYHLTNLLIHLAGGLALFGVVRRTLRRPALAPRFGADALRLAWLVALLWLVHPLGTAAVTYLVQRAEALAGLFYLLTLYGFILSMDSPRPRVWRAASVLCCLAGLATKEMVATAPVVVWLYDRTFVAGTLRAAWRARRGYYAGLAASWLLLGALLWSSGARGGTVGFGAGPAWWDYALTQTAAVVQYLRLAVWPQPLIFDYGLLLETRPGVLAGSVPLTALLLGTTIWAVRRRPAAGFLGAWCWLILAPTTSVIPVVTQVIAEHRMYLPLAGLLALGVTAAYRVWGRRTWLAGGALAAAFGLLTQARNTVYQSEFSIWTDVVRQRPANARAHRSLGNVLLARDDPAGAIASFETAIRLEPESAGAYVNLGLALARAGREEEAAQQYRRALRLQPADPEVLNNLAWLLISAGNRSLRDPLRALDCAQAAARISHGQSPVILDTLACALSQLGRFREAEQLAQRALALAADADDAALAAEIRTHLRAFAANRPAPAP